MIKEKIKKNFIQNQLKNSITTKSQDVSYDNNIKINKEIENGILNQKIINDLSISYNIKSSNKLTKPVYKKKIKISQKKSNIFQNKKLQNNKIMNLSSNDLNKLKQIKLKNSSNLPKQNIKNDKTNKSNTNLNNDNKNDININFNKDIKSLDISEDNKQINENSSNMITHGKLNADKNVEKNIDNGNNMETGKNIEENNIEMGEINKDKNSKMSNGKHNMNEDTDESDDNIIKEIIVKDVSTSDKRLNVFIKYIEMSKWNNKSDTFVQHMLNAFQTDSLYFPASKPKNYYSNKNSKLQKILSSIMEEEEKSKAAGSVNNSVRVSNM